ncbi:glycosyltransferase family 2 protein [Paenirhodobacter populi]|uniref:glycosyltransferase family 2 protein n=1 Tax=Paenirhodobacter populi TaxID=2306993 RepID=UPI0019D4D413|nr:glycosyltransferase family 2 protein [Sinirhodobacter populi]
MSRPTIVSLTTIPSRFHLLAPTLRSLLSQSRPVQEINLYIPLKYRRFPDWDGVLPDVPKGVAIRHSDIDLGPATKILPATREYAGQDIDIIFCDDDKIYDRNWHHRFKIARMKNPNSCIVEAGENLPDISDEMRSADRMPRAKRWVKKPLSYRIKRVLSFFMIKSPMYANSGYVDIFSGHGGVMVKPEWFDEKAWDIPGILWTVDDPWLSGHLERRGIPIWLMAKVRRMSSTDAGNVDALLTLVQDGTGRVQADIAAIDYMRETYNIWKPIGKPSAPERYMSETMYEIAKRAQLKQ